MKTIPAVAVLLMLAACASPPPPAAVQTRLETAPAWSALDSLIHGADAETLQEDWWVEIGGADLDALVREALDANASLAIAAANVEAARATADIAGAPRWPQVGASYNGRRQEQALIGIPVGPDPVLKTRSTSHGAQLQASWEVDLWNRLGNLERAALAEFQATEAELAGARLSLAGAVTRSWLDLVEARAQADLAARAFAAFSETAQTAWERYQRGLIPAIDVHLTRTSRDNAGALVALQRNRVEVVARQLEILLGRYPRALLESPMVLPDAPPAPPAGLPSDLLLRRPDLLAAERRVVAAGSRSAAARREMLPSISLTGTAGYTSNALEDILEGDFSVWSIGGSLLQPIFQGGRLRAQVRQGDAIESAAVHAWANQALSAFGEVEIALASEGWLRERELRLESASASARAAHELSESRYRQGVGSLFEVLESQRGALNAEGQWLSVRNARLKARVDLFLALGGGFDAASATFDFLTTRTNEPEGTDR